MQFHSSSDGQGIVEQTLSLMRVDSVQWPISKIVASCNNYLDTVTGYAIGADRRWIFDNSNHTKEPIGTTDLIDNKSDYSFLTDEQGNPIINLSRVDIKDASGVYRQLYARANVEFGEALDTSQITAGLPSSYTKIADNIIRLTSKPIASVTAGLKFYFQRTSPRFTASSTTTTTGFSPLLDRGFIINAAYDGALTLGFANLSALSVERQVEEKKMIEYFASRNTDEPQRQIRGIFRSSR